MSCKIDLQIQKKALANCKCFFSMKRTLWCMKNEAAYGYEAWLRHTEREVYSSISMAANYFIDNTDKTEIIFGISSKDYDGVFSKIHTKNCEIEIVN